MSVRLRPRRLLVACAGLAGLLLAAPLAAHDGENQLASALRASGDRYGFAVALSGERAYVGVPDGGADSAGRVDVFLRSEGVWYQAGTIDAADHDVPFEFGYELSAQADLLAVAGYDPATTTPQGVVSILRYDTSGWMLEGQVSPPDTVNTSGFGRAIDLDGDTLIVGDPADGLNGPSSGRAHVFVRSGGNWLLEQTIAPADFAQFQTFGYDVAVEGNTAVIAARGDATNGSAAGAVYVYARSQGTWTLDQKLYPAVPAVNQSFGDSVDIDNGTVVVGAEGVAHSGTFFAGAVYVFTKATTWTEQARLTTSLPERNERLGTDVVLRGSILVGGARGDDLVAPDAGSITVWDGAGANWTEREVITVSDAAISQAFGNAIALEGDLLVAGRWNQDLGAAYSFDLAAPDRVEGGALVPKKADLVIGEPAKRGGSPRFSSKGKLDTGGAPVDLTLSGVLTIGTRDFDVPGLVSEKDGKVFAYRENDVTFTVRPDRGGTSAASFDLVVDEDLAGQASPDGVLAFRYVTAEFAAECALLLDGGRFRLAKDPGALSLPALDVRSLRLKPRGPGADAVSAVLGFMTPGAPPETAPDVTVVVGPYRTEIAGTSFQRRGTKLVYTGAAPGLRKLVLDYRKGTAKVVGKGLDLGLWADGPAPIAFRLDLGDQPAATVVRCVRKGKTVRY